MIPSAGVDVTSPTDNIVFTLGEIAWVDGKAYQYVQANGAITGAGYVVTYNQTFDAVMLTTSNDVAGWSVGVPLAAFSDNQYGWVQVFGQGSVRSEQDALANSFLGATTDAGQLDDAAATGLMVWGITFGTATPAADGLNATAFLRWPAIQTRPAPAT